MALYNEQYPGDEVMASTAQAEFESLWGEDALHVSLERLTVDLDRLQAVIEPVKDFADKHVAHLDHTPVEKVPTFDGLDMAINLFGELFSKYYLTLAGSSKGVSATIIDDWTAPFRVAWIEEPSD